MSAISATTDEAAAGSHDAQPRRSALLAGFGTAGSIVGATAVAATVVGGVIAFSTWPGAPDGSSQPRVQLATTAPAAVAQMVTTGIRAADARAAAGAAGVAGARAAGPGGAGEAAAAEESGSGVVPAAVTGSSRGARDDDGLMSLPRVPRTDGTFDEVADMTRDTGVGVAGSVGDGSAGVAEDLSIVAPRTARILRSAGEATDEAVRASSDAAADVLRVLP